jgi:hypothetical protein
MNKLLFTQGYFFIWGFTFVNYNRIFIIQFSVTVYFMASQKPASNQLKYRDPVDVTPTSYSEDPGSDLGPEDNYPDLDFFFFTAQANAGTVLHTIPSLHISLH